MRTESTPPTIVCEPLVVALTVIVYDTEAPGANDAARKPTLRLSPVTAPPPPLVMVNPDDIVIPDPIADAADGPALLMVTTTGNDDPRAAPEGALTVADRSALAGPLGAVTV